MDTTSHCILAHAGKIQWECKKGSLLWILTRRKKLESQQVNTHHHSKHGSIQTFTSYASFFMLQK